MTFITKNFILFLYEKILERCNEYRLYTTGNAGGFDDYWSRMGEIGNPRYMIYLDAPVGFALLYKGLPNALVGLNCPDKNTVMIRQLQGVISYFINDNHAYKKTSARGLMPLDWQKLLVDCTVDIAQTANFERIGIQGYTHNRWVNISSFTSSKAKEKYDGTAERLGFTLKNDQNWYKQL